MKKFLLTLLATGYAFGAISADKVYKLNQYMGPIAVQTKLGTLIDQGGSYDLSKDGISPMKVAQATYDFAVSGGASTADIDLGVTLPAKAIIRRSWLDILTQPVGSGSSVAIYVVNAGNILATESVSTLTVGQHEGVSTGTTANMKKIATAGNVKVTISGNNGLTAGKIKAYIEYVVSQ